MTPMINVMVSPGPLVMFHSPKHTMNNAHVFQTIDGNSQLQNAARQQASNLFSCVFSVPRLCVAVVAFTNFPM